MDSASSFIESSSKVLRGWYGFGRSCVSEISTTLSSSLTERDGINASRPLPSRLLIRNHFLRKFKIYFRAFGFRIVGDNGLSMRRRFAQSHVARNDRLVHLLLEILFHFFDDLDPKISPGIQHR